MQYDVPLENAYFRGFYQEMIDFAGALRDAVNQIKERRYIEGLKAKGYENVVTYGIAFCRKKCKIGRYK